MIEEVISDMILKQIFSLFSSLTVGFATKAMSNLCCDRSERYLSASIDVSYLQKNLLNK